MHRKSGTALQHFSESFRLFDALSFCIVHIFRKSQHDLRDLVLRDQLLDPGACLAQFILVLALDGLDTLCRQEKSVADCDSYGL